MQSRYTPTPGAETRLIEALEPFRGFALASGLQAMFATGIYDRLLDHGSARPDEMAEALSLDEERATALLKFLSVEDVVVFSGSGEVALTSRGEAFGEFRAWYAMMVGGYSGVLASLPESMASGGKLPPRRGDWVATGSAGVDLLCSLPLVRRLIVGLPRPPQLILDVGCGSPEYLAAICMEHGCRGVGVEPDLAAFDDGQRLLQRDGLGDRVQLLHGSAQECIPRLDVVPDLVVTAFVLHEVLGQSAEAGVRRFLRDVFEAAPEAHLLVIEPDLRQDDQVIMRHGYARAFYNGYYLVHPFTGQQLAPRAYWEDLFRSSSLSIVTSGTTDTDLDSTGLEFGWLLRRSG